MTSRRDFVKTLAASGVAIAASDLMADLIAQSPKGRVLESKFKGMSDIALAQAKAAGCSYADIRFTRNLDDSVNVRDNVVGGGGFGGGGGGGGFGGGGYSTSAGFGVRVIHGGVWGFASSPLTTEDEIRKVTKTAIDVAKASAIAKKVDVKLAPTPAFTDYWATPVKQDPFKVPLDDKINFLLKVNEAIKANKGVFRATSQMTFDYEWKYLATSEGSYLEQEVWRSSASMQAIARGKTTKSRTYGVMPRSSGSQLMARIVPNSDITAPGCSRRSLRSAGRSTWSRSPACALCPGRPGRTRRPGRCPPRGSRRGPLRRGTPCSPGRP